MSVFMEDVENFIRNPGEHATHDLYPIMKDTLEYMLKGVGAIGVKNAVATDKIISHLKSKKHKIHKSMWQVKILGYFRDHEIFIGSKNGVGMFLIDTEGDAKETYNFIVTRIAKHQQRKKILEKKAKDAGFKLKLIR